MKKIIVAAAVAASVVATQANAISFSAGIAKKIGNKVKIEYVVASEERTEVTLEVRDMGHLPSGFFVDKRGKDVKPFTVRANNPKADYMFMIVPEGKTGTWNIPICAMDAPKKLPGLEISARARVCDQIVVDLGGKGGNADEDSQGK